MKKENKDEERMCKKLEFLNGLTADTVLNKYWNKNDIPINIAKILYDMDIKVSPFDFTKAEKMAGVENGDIFGAVLTNKDDVIILYNEDYTLNRIRFTLAHELAHCCLSHITPNSKGFIEFRLKNHNNERERQANIFAGEILIPEKELSKALAKFFHNTFPSSVSLSELFAVSVSVMEERLKILKISFINSDNLKVILE